RRGGDRHQGRGDRVRDSHPGAGRVARAGARGGGRPRRGRGGAAPRPRGAGLPGARPRAGVRLRGAARHGVHLSRGRRRRPGLDPSGPARLRRPADRARDAPRGGRGAARARDRAARPARDVPHVEPPHPHRAVARAAPVQALSRRRGGRDPEYRRPAGGRRLAHRRVFPRARAGGSHARGPPPRRPERLRERVLTGVREGGVGVARTERTGGSLMALRRTVVAFAVTFVCALAVFTLPRFVWNTVQGAVRQQPTVDTTQPPPPATAPRAQQAGPRSIPQRLTGAFGIVLILGIGIALSRNRAAISWRVVGWGVGLQLAFAVFVLLVPFGQWLFANLGDVVKQILGFSYVGSEFVFGEIGKQHSSIGLVFAFQVLPAIIFVSALFAILYYLGVMQLVVKAFAVLMNKVMGASGAKSLTVAASIFMGQTEAPLTIRPFLAGMTRSELMTVMTAGMAHVSGSIMAAYIAMGIEARHLLTAVIMTAPGTIMMAKILEPETETPQTLGGVRVEIPRTDVNVVDAAARGTSDGLYLML